MAMHEVTITIGVRWWLKYALAAAVFLHGLLPERYQDDFADWFSSAAARHALWVT